jgi:hypothetical protein
MELPRETSLPIPSPCGGGLWKQIYSSINGFTVKVVKVKAHRTLEQATADGEVEWYKGNDEADMDAKMITQKYRPSESDRNLFDFQAKVANSVLYRAIRNCEAIDAAKMEEPIANKPKNKGKRIKATRIPEVVHDFAWISEQKFQCSKCFKCETSMPRPNGRCLAISGGMEDAISKGPAVGHILNIVDQFEVGSNRNMGPLVFCVKCGAHSVRRCNALKRICPGYPEKGPKERCVQAFAEHKHPNDSKVWLKGFRAVGKGKVQPPVFGMASPARVGSNLLEYDVWFDQVEDIEFGFEEEDEEPSSINEVDFPFDEPV